jgi:hypothetical protein
MTNSKKLIENNCQCVEWCKSWTDSGDIIVVTCIVMLLQSVWSECRFLWSNTRPPAPFPLAQRYLHSNNYRCLISQTSCACCSSCHCKTQCGIWQRLIPCMLPRHTLYCLIKVIRVLLATLLHSVIKTVRLAKSFFLS